MNETIGPVRRTRKHGASIRRQQILDAACTMIFERGYEPVSLAEIGAAAGVSGPAIYRHFESKADILAVLCGQTIDRLIEFVGPRRATPEDEVRALVEGQVKLVTVYPELVRVFEDDERSLPKTVRSQIRRRELDHAQRWIKAVSQLSPDTPIRELEVRVFSTVGMILSAARWPHALRGGADVEARLLAAAWRVLDLP